MRISSHPPASESWHLGIDIGTTGISAVLFHRETRQLYPIYWQSNRSQGDDRQKFRLPAIVTLAATADTPEFVLQHFKPYLKLGIPHYSPTLLRWEPALQSADHLQLPLSWVHQSLQSLLVTLNPNVPNTAALPLSGAMGLGEKAFQHAMRQVVTVGLGYPAGWSDTYSFNLREAVLGARLVAEPEQIFLVEEAIATLLSAIRPADQTEIQLPPHPGQDVHLHHADWQGETLVFHAGATVTEMAMVNLPGRLPLHHQDFQFRTLPYAGSSLDQDIICQLILNRERRGGGEVDLDMKIALEEVYFDDLIFPAPGEPDLAQRYRLHQRLTDSAAGQALLEAAQYLKIKLQQQSSFTLKLGEAYQTILRQDLASQVILPYVQRLNRELNALLTQTGTPVLAVQQVICSGGTASLGAIARWLRQKLPNATIIQDTYDLPPSPQETCIPSCSRVAYGLAVLPLHLSVIDRCRHQYSDYYLLQELLRVFPNHPVTIAEIMILLEHQGIDTQICQASILALLEGHLPAGLVLTQPDALWLTSESRANPDYQSVQLAPLFAKQPDQTYRPNRHQWNHLRSYLDTLLTTTHQKLAEPLALSVWEEA
ncbi:MAG: hypothetical protein HC781_07895 [Leptolyngbyaceae cyanobacterium CSU_1_4]|nr:hypothetical protein [Leptolyngbyaceae cyanobacterium CSU_1_4]